MSNKDLKLSPHNLKSDPNAWWYEEARGISIYKQTPTGHMCVKISWASLRAALKRKDKPSHD